MRILDSRKAQAAALATVLALAPLSLAQAEGSSSAAMRAQLQSLFPQGVREGQEGVMKLGVQFRTVSMSSWQKCRDFCRKTPAANGKGCALWTFIAPEDPKMPRICRMWASVPELRPNARAVSGAGIVK